MDFLTYLQNHIVLFDGAMGTEIQKLHIQESEWGEYTGCNEMLTLSAPDKIAGIHRAYLEAGADVIETNTFGANRIVLSEYGLEERTSEINEAAARLAVGERDQYISTNPSKGPVYVAGSLGPGTKLPSLGQSDFDTVYTSYYQQAYGLIEGGIELFIIETSQDLLQIKAAVSAIKDASTAQQLDLPLIVSVTVESNGSMLVGSDINAVTSTLLPLDIDVVGINCATGPQEMRPHIEELSRQFPGALFCMPNAGFPEHKNGELVYSLPPAEFADVLTSFVSDFGVDVIGGCCGTGPDFIAELRSRIPNLNKGRRPILHEDVHKARWTESALTSLYSRKELEQQPPPFFIGERTNTNGSKKFRTHLLENDWNSMVAMGKAQMKTGAHALDICVAYTGRNEQHDMHELVRRLRTSVDLPLVIDSTSPEVLESALKLIGGRGLINSVNLEDGEAEAGAVFSLAKHYGAAVICLTIDETGMARSVDDKIAVAQRIFRLATSTYGLRPEDLVFDPLTFTLGSGDESLRNAGARTLTALGLIKKKMPGVHTVLGVSNISFGLEPRSREVLNSVFLDEAIQAGLDIAIVNVKKIIPVFKISKADTTAARNLIYNRGSDDPLHAYIAHFAKKKGGPKDTHETHTTLTPKEQLEELVLDGTHAGLLPVLDLLMKDTAPDKIINDLLIPAMKRVGELFGKGKLQLPFVLQSAEVMKQAVGYLEPFMEKQTSTAGKSVVLATVRGDVHDIGKNLVDIILSNNGYKVYNLGIKVDIETVLNKAQEVKAGAIGMSGLLVKSTGIMKSNIEVMGARNLQIPVLLGGAALTREFVEQECAPLLNAPVFYCKDAFDGLQAMEKIEEKTGATPKNIPRKNLQNKAREASLGEVSKPQASPEPMKLASHAVPLPESNDIKQLTLDFDSLLPYINRSRLFRARWGYRRGATSEQEYIELEETIIKPAFEKLIAWLGESHIAPPRAAFRLLPCNRTGDNGVHIFEGGPETGGYTQAAELYFSRQLHSPHLSVADYFLPDSTGRHDLIGLQIVTLGTAIQREIHRLFSNDNYRDYLHLHGLAVELTEAAAEYVQSLMQSKLQPPESGDFQSSIPPATRYSFGYPCCPDLTSNRIIASLLKAEELGITFTEDDQMVPELSTAAFVCFNPQADYFSI